jgi:hypothetical protein
MVIIDSSVANLCLTVLMVASPSGGSSVVTKT